MQFHIFEESRQGARPTNQDRIGYIHTSECLLMVVCDGMGGHLRGEIASQIAVDVLIREFRRLATPRLRNAGNFLFNGILSAHEAICQFAKSNAYPETPRTTCVACVVQDGRAWWAHVGDSRLYLLRAGSVLKKTVDHSHVQNLLDAGLITAEHAVVHPERNKIFNCLGQPTLPRIDVHSEVKLLEGDKILLSSDGFWGPLDPVFIAKILTGVHLPIYIPMLMDLAETLSGRECDNLSTVTMSWVSVSGSPRDVTLPTIDPKTSTVRDDDLEYASKMIVLSSRARHSFRT